MAGQVSINSRIIEIVFNDDITKSTNGFRSPKPLRPPRPPLKLKLHWPLKFLRPPRPSRQPMSKLSNRPRPLPRYRFTFFFPIIGEMTYLVYE
jgi:hypothetical protein